MSDTHTGGCLCGAVKFKTSGRLRSVVACHCHQCRKQTGHYWAATNVSDQNLTVEGADNVTWFVSTPGFRRGFCKDCGSLLFWKNERYDTTSISGGAFDMPTGLTLTHHVFCSDKGDYYEIGDALPQYEKGSPDIFPPEAPS